MMSYISICGFTCVNTSSTKQDQKLKCVNHIFSIK